MGVAELNIFMLLAKEVVRKQGALRESLENIKFIFQSLSSLSSQKDNDLKCKNIIAETNKSLH